MSVPVINKPELKRKRGSVVDKLLTIVKSEKIGKRVKALVSLLENYLLNDTIDHLEYPFHLFYLISFDPKVNQERYLEKHNINYVSFNVQVTITANLLMLTAGMNAFEKGMVTEIWKLMTSLSHYCNENDFTTDSRREIISSLRKITEENSKGTRTGVDDVHLFDVLGFVNDLYTLHDEYVTE